jgi:hypothetical protein
MLVASFQEITLQLRPYSNLIWKQKGKALYLISKMADCSDPRIAEAYADVRSNTTETNWMTLQYETNKKIIFHRSGSDGVSGLHLALEELEVGYAYIRFQVGDEKIKNYKFVFITWAKPEAGVMKKANLSVHVAKVKEIVKEATLFISAESTDNIEEGVIISQLQKAMGSY